MLFASAVLIAVISAGASYIQAKKAQKKAKEMTQGVETNIESNSKEIPVVYGERRVGGVRVYIDTSRDTKHKYLYMVLAMAEGEVESITDIKIDDIPITDARFITSGNKQNLWYETYTGTDTQNVSTLIKDGVKYNTTEDVWDDPWNSQHDRDTQFPNVTYPWGDNHRLQGVAYLALKFKWDEKAYNGIPDVTAVVKGRKVYDPRTQTTQWSNNPALCIRDYLTNPRYGKGLPESAIDDAAFGQAATDCENFTVTPYTGSLDTHQLFTMDHVVDTSKKILENLNDMLLSCRAFLPYSKGVYSLKIDQPSASVLSIGADQIISGIAIAGNKKEDRFNQVKVNFFNKGLEYKEDQAIYPETNSTLYQAYLAEDDNEPLIEEVDIFSLNNFYSAREMARLILERSRQNSTISFNGTSELINLEVGEVVSITHPTPAWNNKLFQVQEVALNFDGTVNITCIEYDAALYTYDTPDEEQPFIGSRLPDPNQVDPATNLSVSAGSYIENDGKTIGYIDASWSAPEDELVDRYEIKFEYDNREDVIEIASTEYRFKPTQDNVNYVVSVRAVNGLGIRSEWLTHASVTSAADTTAPSDITSPTISGGLQAIDLSWTNPSDDDFDLVRIKVANTNVEPASHSFEVRSNEFLHEVGAYNATRHYWVAPVDRTGNVGNYVYVGTETTGQPDYNDLTNTPTIPTIPEVAGTFYISLGDSNAPTDTEFNTAVGRDPLENDFVIVSYPDGTGTSTKGYNYNGDPLAWTEVTEYIDGSMIVTGSLSASDITTGTLNANDVTISNLTVSYSDVTGTPDLSNFITGGDVNSNVTSISGGVIQAGTAITVGTGDNVAILSGADTTYRLWAGNATSTDAPFAVTQTGILSATGAIIDGNITANSLDVENATVTGTFVAPIGWSNNIYSGVINRGNLNESVKDLIDERIAEVTGGISGDFGQDDGYFSHIAQGNPDPDNPIVLNITHEAGKNLTVELSGSRSWNREFIGLPETDMGVSITLERSPAGANTWTTLTTLTDSGSSITTSQTQITGTTYAYSISIYHVLTDDQASGNYDYRARTTVAGSAYNVSIPLQLTVVEPATVGAGNADTLDNQDGAYYLDYNNFTNTPSTTNWDTAYGWGDHSGLYLEKYTELSSGDLDTFHANESGIYFANANYGSVSNVPYANYFTLLNLRNPYNDVNSVSNSNDRCAQLWFGDTPAGGIRWRAYQGSTTGWHDWEKIYTDNDFSPSQISNWDTAYTYSQVGHLPLSGGTLSGSLSVNGGADINIGATAGGDMGDIVWRLADGTEKHRLWDGGSSLYYRSNGSGANRVFHDAYHPNADKWTTARTLSLTGDVTGSVSWDGSDNASITATVLDDSHNHSNYLPRSIRTGCSNAAEGWYRIAISSASSGRGSFQISFYTYGGSNGPGELIIRGMKTYGTSAPKFHSLEQKGSQYVSKVRGVQDTDGYGYIEVYIASARTALGIECTSMGIGNFRVSDTAVLEPATGTETAVSPEYDVVGGKRLIGRTVNDGELVSEDGLTVKGQPNTAHMSGNETAVNIGTYINQYGYVEIRSESGSGGWIDFGYADGADYRGRIRYDNAGDIFKIYIGGSETHRFTSGGAIRTDGVFSFLTFGGSAQEGRFKSLSTRTSYNYSPPDGMMAALNGFQVDQTTVIDSSRNLVNVGNIYPSGSSNSGRIYADEWGLKVGTTSGYIQFGPANTSWAHIYTDRPAFYFNKELYVSGKRVWRAQDNANFSKIDVGGTGFNASQGVAQFRGDVTLNRGSFVRWANSSGGTGEYIYSKSASPYDVTIHSGSYDSLRCPNNGIVYIAHQGSTKITTTSGGVSITGALTASGNVTAYSDIRKKKDVVELESGIDYINKIDAVRFTWKESEKRDIGFIAQDVEKHLPEFITDEEIYDYTEEAEVIDTVKTLDYSRMTAVLWKAVKEQQEQIETLKSEIEELKNANSN